MMTLPICLDVLHPWEVLCMDCNLFADVSTPNLCCQVCRSDSPILFIKVIAVVLSRCNNTEIEDLLEQKDCKVRKAAFNSK